MISMKIFGKFEKDNNDNVYRTKTFICLNGNSRASEPKKENIVGTIFMLNPGASRPLGSDINDPFKSYVFNEYTELEPDPTMQVFVNVFTKLQSQKKKYVDGVIEIKNLFNYREPALGKEDQTFLRNSIISDSTKLNTDSTPIFHGSFVFFAWGPTGIKNKEIKEYARKILEKSKQDKKEILYISPKDCVESKKNVHYYHPLGGKWKSDTRLRFNSSIYDAFDTLKPICNFRVD